MDPFEKDEYYMKLAIKEAETAFTKDEVPVGAIVVCNEKVIARAYNMSETLTDPTAHAEMQVITAATSYLGGKYLIGCTVYITLEPCVMCAGALFWSQPSRIVFGAYDEKRGYSMVAKNLLHPKTNITGGVLDFESRALLKKFFSGKR